MNTQDDAQIRSLTSEEIEDVSGALKITVGPVRIKLFEDGLIFSVAVNGVGSFNVDDQGVWGDVGGHGYSIP